MICIEYARSMLSRFRLGRKRRSRKPAGDMLRLPGCIATGFLGNERALHLAIDPIALTLNVNVHSANRKKVRPKAII